MDYTSLKEKVDAYLEYADIKSISRANYRKILYKFADYINDLPNLPTRKDVINYRESLINKGLKSTTVQNTIVCIRNFYRWFYANGYGPDIAVNVKGMKIDASTFRKEALSSDNSKRLIEATREVSEINIFKLRNYAVIYLLITTGLRTIEIERADVQDIVMLNDTYVLYVRGKGHDDKDSYVKLGTEVYEAIQQYLIARSDEYKPLFINHRRDRGQRMKADNISVIVKEELRKIGIDHANFTAHSLRHTAATLSFELGANIEDTQHLLRHTSPTVTQRYLNSINKKKKNFEQLISTLLSGKD